MLRATLRLVRPGLDEAQFDRENLALRDIGRTLSALRDADVFIEVIRDLAPDHATSAFDKVLSRVRQNRRRVAAEMAQAETITQARRDILTAQARVGVWTLDDVDRDAITEGLRISFKRAQKSAAAVRRGGDDDLWHEWRKRIKDLWYHLRLVRSVWPGVLDGAIVQVKALADVLGDDHDLAVITGRLRPFIPAGAARERNRLRRAIERRRHDLQQQARDLGRCLLPGSPRRFVSRFEACWHAWRS